MGFGVTKQQLLRKVGKLARANNSVQKFGKTGIPGPAYWLGFKSRHPDIALRKTEPLSTISMYLRYNREWKSTVSTDREKLSMFIICMKKAVGLA